MPTFYVFDGIRICLYFYDHNPPHFHAFYAEFEVLVEISTKSVMQGEMPKKQLKKVLDFANHNEEELLEIWNELQK